jgi:hypothetical protein
MWKPRCLTTLWASTACYRDSFTFIMDNFYLHHIINRIDVIPCEFVVLERRKRHMSSVPLKEERTSEPLDRNHCYFPGERVVNMTALSLCNFPYNFSSRWNPMWNWAEQLSWMYWNDISDWISWSRGYSAFIFGKCSVRISTGTPGILTFFFLSSNSWMLLWVGHDRFLPNNFQFSHHPAVQRCLPRLLEE